MGIKNYLIDRFIDWLDGVFVLEIDLDTLNRRLAARPEDAWGGSASERASFAHLQRATKEGLLTNAIINEKHFVCVNRA